MEDTGMGTFRPSMAKNYLLDRSQVGACPKPFCKLPGPDFTYGRKYPSHGGGVKLAISDWNARESVPRERHRLPNFVKINADAIKAGSKTIEDLNVFRDDNKQLPKYEDNAYQRTKMTKIPNVTFGVHSGPHLDMASILSYRFREAVFNSLKEKEARSRKANQAIEKKILNRPREIEEIRAAMSRNQPAPETLWKMPRFANAKPRICTWWKCPDIQVETK